MNNCIWRGCLWPSQRAGMQLLVQSGGSAIALRLLSTRYMLPNDRKRPQRRRSCQHCPVTFMRTSKLVGHLWTVQCQQGHVHSVTHHCDVCGKTFPLPQRVRRRAERGHNVLVDWKRRLLIPPPSPVCTSPDTVCPVPIYVYARRVWPHVSICGCVREHVVSSPTALPPLPICHSRRSRALPDSQWNGDRWCW